MKPIPTNRYVAFALIVTVGLFWDLYSKSVVFQDLGYPAYRPMERGEHELFPHPAGIEGRSDRFLDGWVGFSLYTSFNEGALWGLGQGYTWLFALLSLAAAVGIVYWLFLHRAAVSLWLTVSLAFIMAGTLGNLYDRFALHGYTNPVEGEPVHAVRDFLLFTFGGWPWPVFNFADVFLVTGAAMLVVQSFFPGMHEAAAGAAEHAAPTKPAEVSEPQASVPG